MHRIFGKGTVLLKIGLVMAMVAMVLVYPESRAMSQAQKENGGTPTLSDCRVNYFIDRELCKFWRDYDNQTQEEYQSCKDEAEQDKDNCVDSVFGR